jgi:hypothetical protein
MLTTFCTYGVLVRSLTPHECPANLGDLHVRVDTVTMKFSDGKGFIFQDDLCSLGLLASVSSTTNVSYGLLEVSAQPSLRYRPGHVIRQNLNVISIV